MPATKQHVIDPEICIRCNTCEETCPIDAVTHNDDNYVVDPAKCNYCMDCISPCPTGAIDNWRVVLDSYSIDEQFEWFELPEQDEISDGASGASGSIDALDEEAAALIAEAHEGVGGHSIAPPSASKPSINLFNRGSPAPATCVGNFRITDIDAESDVRHIILDFGQVPFPVLEGQSIGVVPPGERANGRPHAMRLYSVSSSRDGEKPNTNNLALTIKRVVELRDDASTFRGLASNYMCDLERGDKVNVVGPFGATFLMPDDPSANIIMICTGTGSAPFRAFTERRRRAMPQAPGKLYLFFGARTPGELPYFGPLKKVPTSLLDKELVFSRLADRPKEYVQDRMLKRGEDLAEVLSHATAHIFVCGLKGMEEGVDASFAKICADLSHWPELRDRMRAEGRYHVETY